MRRSPIYFIVTLLIVSSATTGFAQFSFDGSLFVDGVERTYILHLPTETIEESVGLPLVFNLHGYTSNAAQQQFYSGMDATADANNFIVCYPEGIDNAWNIGIAGGSTADDVAFISAMIDEFSNTYQINTKRVYSCGMSNGGFMSYELACKIPEKIAAIASVTGSMVNNIDCDLNTTGMPVLQIHGTADQVVPYAGGNGFMSMDNLLEFWTVKNGCLEDLLTITPTADTDTTDGSTVEHFIYSQCDTDYNVELLKVNGGEHTWPGASLTFLGVTNQDISANDEIWKFFSRYTLDGTATSVNETQVNDLVISPVPADQTLQVTLSSGQINQITLHDANGHQVMNTQGKSHLDVGHLPAGYYVLCLLTDDEVLTKRVIIQH